MYSLIFSLLPTWAKCIVIYGFIAVVGVVYAHSENAFPKVFGLEQYNAAYQEAARADARQEFLDNLRPCGDDEWACDLRKESPDLYADVTHDGPATLEKLQVLYEARYGRKYD